METKNMDETTQPQINIEWIYLAIGIPVAWVAYSFEAFWIVPLYVFVSVAVLRPELIREGFTPRESKLSEADKSAMTEATELVDTLIRSQKLKLSDAERASMILDNYFKLKTVEAKDA